jgi:hypothetical protein
MFYKRIVDSLGPVECRDGNKKKLGVIYRERVDAELEVGVPSEVHQTL